MEDEAEAEARQTLLRAWAVAGFGAIAITATSIGMAGAPWILDGPLGVSGQDQGDWLCAMFVPAFLIGLVGACAIPVALRMSMSLIRAVGADERFSEPVRATRMRSATLSLVVQIVVGCVFWFVFACMLGWMGLLVLADAARSAIH